MRGVWNGIETDEEKESGEEEMSMGGHMLHGVDHVAVIGSSDDVFEMKTDGRVYMWANGAVTVYPVIPAEPWIVVPAHRIVEIVGGEHG